MDPIESKSALLFCVLGFPEIPRGLYKKYLGSIWVEYIFREKRHNDTLLSLETARVGIMWAL